MLRVQPTPEAAAAARQIGRLGRGFTARRQERERERASHESRKSELKKIYHGADPYEVIKNSSKRIKTPSGKLSQVDRIFRQLAVNQSTYNKTTNKTPAPFTQFEFNLMYLTDTAISKKYYELYTAYQMLLHTIENMQYFMTMYRNELYQMVEIQESVDPKTAVYKKSVILKEDLSNLPIVKEIYSATKGSSTDISSLFGIDLKTMKDGQKGLTDQTVNLNAASKEFRNAVNKHFQRYRANSALFSFTDVGKSQIPVFEHIIQNYVQNRDLKAVLLRLSTQYTLLKTKILNTLTDESTGTILFGLMSYGFLFSNKYFIPIHPTDPNNIFINPELYDMAAQNVNADSLYQGLNKRIFEMGENLKSKLTYFYTGQYRNTILYELIMMAMDMDLAGLQIPLYYCHPEYMKLFIKRKAYIDRQIHNYTMSSAIQNVPKMGDKNDKVFKNFMESMDGDGLFKTYGAYLDSTAPPAPPAQQAPASGRTPVPGRSTIPGEPPAIPDESGEEY